MKLINQPEINIPNEFFIFINGDNQQTKNNIERTNCIVSSAFLQHIEESDKDFANKYLKGLISAFVPPNTTKGSFSEKYLNGGLEYLPFNINQNCDVNFVSMFCHNITSNYTTEYNCEVHRKNYKPMFTSRLSGCYAFGDYESCLEVSRKYGWNINAVRKFKLIEHKDNRVVKVNMEIVSLQRYAGNVAMIDAENLFKIWESYWNGVGELKMELPTMNGRQTFKTGVIWEYLVEGILTLV